MSREMIPGSPKPAAELSLGQYKGRQRHFFLSAAIVLSIKLF